VPLQFVTDQYTDSSVTTSKLADASITGAKLAADAKASALQSKLVGRWVQVAEQASPSASTMNVKTLLGFDSAAGVDPEGVAKGKDALLEAANGNEFNTTTGKVGANARARSSKVPIMDASGDAIVDSVGREVWGVISCSARTTAGSYTLRFFSGEFGSGTEIAYTMASPFVFAYAQIFDLNDMPVWDDATVAMVDKSAAQLAAGQIVTSLLAADAVTSAKLSSSAADDSARAVSTNHVKDSAISSTKIANGAVVAGKYAAGSIANADMADSAVSGAKIANGGVSAGKYAAGSIATADIADDAVDAGKLKDSVATDADRAVTTNHIRNLAITNDKIASSTIGAGKFAAGAIATGDLANDAVTLAKIGARAKAESLDGGNATKHALVNVVPAAHYPGIHAFRNGQRARFVTGVPASIDEYRVIEEGGATKIEWGASIPAGQTVQIDYMV